MEKPLREEDDTQMSGVEEKKEEEGEQMEVADGEEKASERTRRKVIADEDRMMGFGPYHMNTYGEVLRRNPLYARYLIEEGKRDNQKARFAHWAMAFAVETFLVEDRNEMEKTDEGGSQMRWTGEMKKLVRVSKRENRSRSATHYRTD